MIEKIISGGQTGVDRAALDAAIELSVPIGGWCPLGRLAEDGTVPNIYPLIELRSASYPARTRKNVEAAGAVLVLVDDESQIEGGTFLTLRYCRMFGRPYRPTMIGRGPLPDLISVCQKWLEEEAPRVLCVAGPRESKAPGIYGRARAFLLELLRRDRS